MTPPPLFLVADFMGSTHCYDPRSMLRYKRDYPEAKIMPSMLCCQMEIVVISEKGMISMIGFFLQSNIINMLENSIMTIPFFVSVQLDP